MNARLKIVLNSILTVSLYFTMFASFSQGLEKSPVVNAFQKSDASVTVTFYGSPFNGVGRTADVTETVRAKTQAGTEFKILNTATADTLWTRSFPGNGRDEFASVQQTADGGYIMAGKTNSTGAGDYDGWLVKTNSAGQQQWSKTFGDSYIDEMYSVKQTADGGYIISGMSTKFGWAGEGWLVKTNPTGTIEWEHGYHPENGSSETFWEYLYDVTEVPGGGYIAVGYAALTENMIQGWLLKVDAQGIVQWENLFGGEYWDRMFSVHPTPDGNYIAAGDQHATYNDSVFKHDGWLVKFTGNGDTLWTRHYGAQEHDIFRSVVPNSGGGFIIAGERQITEAIGYQGWIVRTDESGNPEWSKAYSTGALCGIQLSAENEILASGTHMNNQTMYDGWLIKVNQNGDDLWNYFLPGSNLDDMFSCLKKTSDGALVAAGRTKGEMTQGEGWLVKMVPDAQIPLLHFVQNFDTVVPPSLPTNWAIMKDVMLSNTVAEVKTMEQGSTTSAPNAVFIMNGINGSNGQLDTTAFVALVTPYVTVGNTGARLIFYGNGGNNLEVGTMSNPNDPATFTLVEEVQLSYNFTVDTVIFSSPGNTYIALKHKNSMTCMPIFIDDVTYEQIINVGVPEIHQENLGAYPNPVHDMLHLTFTSAVKSIHLIDCLGQTVFTKDVTGDNTLDISTLDYFPGTYILHYLGTMGDRHYNKLILTR